MRHCQDASSRGMKRYLAGIVAPLVALGFGAMTVYASSGAATPFKVQYPGTPGSAWSCAGAHVVNKVTIQDSESCLITGDTSPYVVGTFTSGQVCPANANPPYPPAIVGTTVCGQFAPFTTPEEPAFWISDFNGNIATSWTIVMKNNGDGTFTADVLSHYSS